MARRSSSTDAVVLGLGFAVDTERERGEKPGAQVEGLVPDLILAQQRPGWTETDRKSTRLNSSHIQKSRMPSSA